jgi:hypothetical protein
MNGIVLVTGLSLTPPELCNPRALWEETLWEETMTASCQRAPVCKRSCVNDRVALAAVLLLTALSALINPAGAQEKKPNILVIFGDDVGL